MLSKQHCTNDMFCCKDVEKERRIEAIADGDPRVYHFAILPWTQLAIMHECIVKWVEVTWLRGWAPR